VKSAIFFLFAVGVLFAQPRREPVKDPPMGPAEWYTCHQDADCVLAESPACVSKFEHFAINKNSKREYKKEFAVRACKKTGVKYHGDVQVKCHESTCSIVYKGEVFSGRDMF
jgi:hypothetical protein